MMINSNDLFKQLAINSLLNSTDLQEQVKQFVFYDRTEAEARRNKKGLINQLKLGLRYLPAINYQNWLIGFRYEVQLQAVNCPCCGQYIIANNEDFTTLGDSIVCKCDDEYVDEIMTYTQQNRRHIIEEENEEIRDDWTLDNNAANSNRESLHIVSDNEDAENEDEPFGGITIDYGISHLLRYF